VGRGVGSPRRCSGGRTLTPRAPSPLLPTRGGAAGLGRRHEHRSGVPSKGPGTEPSGRECELPRGPRDPTGERRGPDLRRRGGRKAAGRPVLSHHLHLIVVVVVEEVDDDRDGRRGGRGGRGGGGRRDSGCGGGRQDDDCVVAVVLVPIPLFLLVTIVLCGVDVVVVVVIVVLPLGAGLGTVPPVVGSSDAHAPLPLRSPLQVADLREVDRGPRGGRHEVQDVRHFGGGAFCAGRGKPESRSALGRHRSVTICARTPSCRASERRGARGAWVKSAHTKQEVLRKFQSSCPFSPHSVADLHLLREREAPPNPQLTRAPAAACPAPASG
jgi:hypothetical protein